MENNKRSFKKGVIIGLIPGILLTIIMSVALIVNIFKADFKALNYRLNPINTMGEYEKTDLDFDKIRYKLEYLQNMVDKYYLFEKDPILIEDNIYKGLIRGLDDAYSEYYSKEELDAMLEASSGTYYGIGVQVSQNMDTGIVTIVRVFVGSPAEAAGILPNDILHKANGEDIFTMDINTVVSKIKGAEGTYVNIEIYRPSTDEYIEMDVKRGKVEVDTTSHKMLTDKVGYIQLMEFDDVTYSQFMKAYEELTLDGMQGLIVDLRGNPGGLLTSATDILDEILPEGIILYTEDANGKGDEYRSNDSNQINIPMVVLINGSSASASELFASAVKDFEWGTIVGTTSYGKGIMQSIIPIGDGSGVKLTTGRFFTKSGEIIHGNGVAPDVEVELDEGLETQIEIAPEDDNQLQKCIEVINEKLQ